MELLGAADAEMRGGRLGGSALRVGRGRAGGAGLWALGGRAGTTWAARLDRRRRARLHTPVGPGRSMSPAAAPRVWPRWRSPGHCWVRTRPMRTRRRSTWSPRTWCSTLHGPDYLRSSEAMARRAAAGRGGRTATGGGVPRLCSCWAPLPGRVTWPRRPTTWRRARLIAVEHRFAHLGDPPRWSGSATTTRCTTAACTGSSRRGGRLSGSVAVTASLPRPRRASPCQAILHGDFRHRRDPREPGSEGHQPAQAARHRPVRANC